MKKILLSMFAVMLAGMMQAQFMLSINDDFVLTKDTTITITDFDEFDGDVEMGFTGVIISSAKVYVDITRPAGAKDELCAGACLEGNGNATQTMEFDLSMKFYAGQQVPVFAHYYPTQPGVATYTYTFRSGTQSACLTVKYAYKAKPLSFPRKHLIEHFTGEQCGYCPYGMACIEQFLASTSKKYIWVGHHYGYGTDEYTIDANATIGKKLGISGAPSVSFDRTKRRVNGATNYGFHPGYLSEAGAVPLTDADTALASVVIDRTYDAASRQLTLTVHGEVLSEQATSLLLSVLVKESGMIGQQKDFYDSWEGWSEFRHVKTVRVMLSAAWGDKVDITNGEYTKTYTYTLPAKFVAENCEVVAYITPNSTTVQPILNAEQIAVVDGTDGGESLLAEGIKAVPVSETYPESGAPMANVTFTAYNLNTNYLLTNGYVVMTLQAPELSVVAGGYPCFPYLQLYIFTRTANLTAGTYPISDTYNYGVVAAGYRNDDKFTLGGSMLNYVFSQNGGLYKMAQWLLRDGSVTIGGNGSVEVNATTFNGSKFHGVYGTVTPIENIEDGAIKRQGKILREGKVVILREGAEYDLFGKRMR